MEERKPDIWWLWNTDATDSLAKTVHEERPGWSGLYDKDGNKLYRPKPPMGFVDFGKKEKP